MTLKIFIKVKYQRVVFQYYLQKEQEKFQKKFKYLKKIWQNFKIQLMNKLFLKMLKNVYDLDVPNDDRAIEALADAGFYLLGPPGRIAEQITEFHEASGGFGTFLIVTGKDWANREKRERSMTRFMEEVAPKVRHLSAPDTDGVAAQ